VKTRIDSPGDDALSDDEQLLKDRSYAPSSGRETRQRQESPDRSRATDDVDAEGVETLPGTGGPDDNGAVDVDPEELNVPRDRGAH
jgi:hypothetical protein